MFSVFKVMLWDTEMIRVPTLQGLVNNVRNVLNITFKMTLKDCRMTYICI